MALTILFPVFQPRRGVPEHYTRLDANGVPCRPVFIFDPANGVGGTRELDAQDYIAEADGPTPVFIFDPQNGFGGTRDLSITDYSADDTQPVFVFDPQNSFGGTQ